MKTYCIDDLIEKIYECVERHKLGIGQYSRWLWADGNKRHTGINEYGCADAANILFTIGRFPSAPEERAEWVKVLQSMQNPETGMYHEPTHRAIHSTAHCSAALELFDAEPLYKCRELEKYTDKEALYDFLENGIDWQKNPWGESHNGAGLLPALDNTHMIDLEWKNWYFDWIWEHTDSENGFVFYAKNGEPKQALLYQYMASGFHYLFNIEAEHRPLRYPEKIIDSCLTLINMGCCEENNYLHRRCEFIDIDVIYCLTRAMRQTPYRFDEGKKALDSFADEYIKMMYEIDTERDIMFTDMHTLFAAVCCLAELQSALPGKLLTTKPLKLVLDRRPFI